MSDMELGVRVAYDIVFERKVEYVSKAFNDQKIKTWIRSKRPMREGLLIGLRTIFDGVSTWEGNDEGWSWEDGRHPHNAALVIWHLRRKPDLVPFDSLVFLDKEAEGE